MCPCFWFWQNQKPAGTCYTCNNNLYNCRIIKLHGLAYFNDANHHVKWWFLIVVNLFYLQIHRFYCGFITKIGKESWAENGASSGRVLQHYFEAMAWMDIIRCFQGSIELFRAIFLLQFMHIYLGETSIKAIFEADK